MLTRRLALLGRARQIAAAYLALVAGTTLSPLVSLTRASAGTAISSAGELVTLAANQPRWQHDPANTTAGPIGLTNHIRNPRGEGANTGSYPTDWTISAIGCTVTYLGSVVENGIPCVDLRVDGVTSSTAVYPSINFTGTGTGAPVVQGDNITSAGYMRLLAGSDVAIPSRGLIFSFYDTNGNYVGNSTMGYFPTAELQRYSMTRTVTDSRVAYARPGFYFNPSPAVPGTAFGFTLRIGAPQLYKLASDPGAIILPPPGMIGAWTEQHYVNGFRNPRGEGGIVGPIASGGALPPEVTIIGARTLSLTYAGQGVENGLPYMAIRIHGLAASNSSWVIGLAGTQTIPAANGEDWTCAYHARLAAGTLNGITLANTVRFRTIDGFHQQNHDVAITPTNAPLGSQRQSMTLRAAMPSIAYVTGGIRVAEINGQMVDCTIHIGVPGLFKLGFDPGYTPLPPVGQPGRSGNLRVVGLLNEEQRTNLIPNPRTVARTGWTNANLASVVDVAGPDGEGTGGALITENTANGLHETNVTMNVTAGESYYFTTFAKPGTCTSVKLLGGTAGFSGGAWANFSLVGAGVVVAKSDTTTAKITRLPTGWYLLEVVFVATVTTTGGIFAFHMTLDGDTTRITGYTGTGRNVTVAYPMVAAGTHPTSLILPAVGATGPTTRLEDVLTVPRSALPTDLSRGTLVAKWRSQFTQNANHYNIFTLAEAGQTRRYAGFVQSGGSFVAGRAGISGAPNLPLTPTSANRDGTLNRYAFSWSPENAGQSLNGSAAVFNSFNGMFGVDPGDGLRLFGAATSISMLPCVIESVTLQQATATAAGLQSLAA